MDLPHVSCDIPVIPAVGTSSGEQWGVVVVVSGRGFMEVLECPLHPEQQSHFFHPKEEL